jgi:hypothetical protein
MTKEFRPIVAHLKKKQEEFEQKSVKRGKGLYDRDDQGKYWWELRDCDYYKDFAREKLAWIELTDLPKFAVDKEGYFLNNSGYIMVGENIKYLCSVLNSKLSSWVFNLITTSSGVGTNRWIKTYIEQIPIPEISQEAMKPFEILVDYITFIKKYRERISPYTPNDHMAVNFEELVDACVYELYFKEHMEEKGITVLKEVNELLKPIGQLNEKTEADEIVKIINAVYDEYKGIDNIIRRRVLDFPIKSPDIINIIQNG